MRRCRACPGPHPESSLRATTRREAQAAPSPLFWPRLPGVDEPSTRMITVMRGGRGQRVDDDVAGLGRVDHIVDLEQRSGVERLGVFLCGGRRLMHPLLPLLLVGDRLEFLAQ